MGLLKNAFNGLKNFFTKPHTTNNEKLEIYLNEQFIYYKNNKKLEDICVKFLKENSSISLHSLEFGFIPFEYEENSYADNRPEILIPKYHYNKDNGLYSFYANQISQDVIKKNKYYIKDAMTSFHDKYIYGYSYSRYKSNIKNLFEALNSQDILKDNRNNAFYAFMFYMYYLKRNLTKEKCLNEIRLYQVDNEYDLIYKISNIVAKNEGIKDRVNDGDIYSLAAFICVLGDSEELISRFEFKNIDSLKRVLQFHINEQRLKQFNVDTKITNEYTKVVDSMNVLQVFNKVKQQQLAEDKVKKETLKAKSKARVNAVEAKAKKETLKAKSKARANAAEAKAKKEILKAEAEETQAKKEEALVKKTNKIMANIINGFFPTDYSTLRHCDNYTLGKHFKNEYDNNIQLIMNTLEENCKVFNKYCDNKQLNLIIKNFLIENKDIAEIGSVNPFILNSKYFDNIKIYDNSYYVFDRGLAIKNALNKYKIANSDMKELKTNTSLENLKNSIKMEAASETYSNICISDLTYRDIGHEKYIKILTNAYKSISFSDEENTFILSDMNNGLRKACEYVSSLPIELYQLSVHLFVNGFDKNYKISGLYGELMFEYVKELYERIKTQYKAVLLLKNGLINKFKDLSEHVFYSLLQYKLNEHRLEKVKEFVSNMDNIEYNDCGLYLLKGDAKADKNIEYFYSNNYKIDEVVKIDKFLNNVTLGTELLELIRVDNKLNIVKVNKKYTYLIKKYDELKAVDYVNQLSNKNYKAKNTISMSEIDLMSGYEFEKFIAKLFKKMGYEAYVTQESNDQGVDVIVEKNNVKIAIQTKCYNGTVGNGAIQEAVAGMKYYDADRAMVITNSTFTKSAIELANKNNVQLWDRRILIEKINDIA